MNDLALKTQLQVSPNPMVRSGKHCVNNNK